MIRRSDFPPGFVFGTATSAYQIEGAARADGRGESIWDRFAATPGNIADGSDGSVACDHYNRWEADLDLIHSLGVGAYRFSVAWPRIVPAGTGQTEQPGLDFYDRLVDGLLERGLEPHLTLYHWDLPQALADQGGWLNRDTALAFGDYAAVVAERLGDRPVTYSTLNEPWCSAFLGYLTGEHAPGERDLRSALTASHHLLLAHGYGLEALRATVPEVKAGIVLNFSPAWPATDDPADIEAARRHDGFFNRWFTEPLFRGSYPQDMLELYGELAPRPEDVDLQLISRPLDFLGVNYYNRAVIRDDPAQPLGYAHVRTAGEHTAMDWEVYPDALKELLVQLHRDCAPRELYVTENGAAFDDPEPIGGRVSDPSRTAYLQAHLQACLEAVQRGVPLRGYFAWSLLDNFEWAHGYRKRFGIVHVDYATQERTLKDSALWYRDFLQGQSIDSSSALVTEPRISPR